MTGYQNWLAFINDRFSGLNGLQKWLVIRTYRLSVMTGFQEWMAFRTDWLSVTTGLRNWLAFSELDTHGGWRRDRLLSEKFLKMRFVHDDAVSSWKHNGNQTANETKELHRAWFFTKAAHKWQHNCSPKLFGKRKTIYFYFLYTGVLTEILSNL